jgi:hypothetical protein
MRVWRRGRTLLAVPVALLVLLGFPVRSQASVGIGVQDNPVQLAGVAYTGESYSLPPVAIINTGTEAEGVIVRIERISHGPGRPVPPSWVRATGPGVRLSPHQTARVPLELSVPADAKPGPYLSDVVVVAATLVATGKANLGVAAATKLEFRVARGAAPGSAIPGWTWWSAGALALLAAAAFAVRRSGLTIRVERRPSASSAADDPGG